MAPLSPRDAQDVIDSARTQSRTQLGAQMAMITDIEAELRRQGRSTRPEDLLPELRNAEAREEYLLNLSEYFDNKMDISAKIGEAVVKIFERTSGEVEEVRKQISNLSRRSQAMMDIIKQIVATHPLEANEVLQDRNFNMTLRNSTNETLGELRARIEGFYGELSSKFEEVHRQVLQECRFEEFKQTFDDCVKKARYASQAAEASLAKIKSELDTTKQDLAEKDQTVEDLTTKLEDATARIAALEKDAIKAEAAAKSERNTLETAMRDLQSQLNARESRVSNLDNELKIANRDLTAERHKVNDKDGIIRDLKAAEVEAGSRFKEQLASKDEKIQDFEEKLLQADRDLVAQRQKRDEDVQSMDDKIRELNAAQIKAETSTNEQLAYKNDEITSLKAKVLEITQYLDKERQDRIKEMSIKDAEIQGLTAARITAETDTNDMLASKDGEIQDVRAKLSELEKSSDQAASDYAGKLTDSEGEMAAAKKSERTATELNTEHVDRSTER